MTTSKNSLLQNFIKKYYLNGLVKSVQIDSKNGNLFTIFRSRTIYANDSPKIRGVIHHKNFGLPNAILGDYSPEVLLKILPVLGEDIEIDVRGLSDNGHASSLLINDSSGCKLKYSLTPPELCDFDGIQLRKKFHFQFKIKLDKALINKILKAINATDSKYLAFFVVKKKMVIAYNHGQYTELRCDLADYSYNCFHQAVSMDVKYFKTIIKNNLRFDIAYMQISEKEIAQFFFKEKDLISKYWVRCY